MKIAVRTTFIGVVAAMLLGLTIPASAQNNIPALAPLPATVAASNPNLSSLRSKLVQERETLHGKVDSLNAQCASVAKGSAAAASCSRSQADLRAALNSHIQQSRDYNGVVQAAVIAAPSP